MSSATWLPNLVSGASIWKLAVDLNEPKFFDGRLLVPETEGSESLPVTVRWDLAGLVPLHEARAKWPDDTAAAVRDFQTALERVAKVFATPNSGYDKYKEAFTVPSLEAEGGANYFYAPDKKKVFVINWGASPRALGGKAEYVFGYEDWGRVFKEKEAELTPSARLAAAGSAAATARAAGVVGKAEESDGERKEKRESQKSSRPWWIWPVFALIAIAIVLLALFFLRSCEEPAKTGPKDATGDVEPEASAANEAGTAADADTGDASGATNAAEAGALADGGDAGPDAAAGAAADAGKDGGKDAGKDGGLAMEDDDDDDGAGGGGGSGGGSGGVAKVVIIGPAAPGGAGGGGGAAAKVGPHRRHYQADAVKWRVAAGFDRVALTEQRERRFDVWLGPGRTFEGVRVEWQDAAGKWHPH